jgi:hypothetical protein
MNRNTDEKMGTPSRREGKQYLNTLRDRGILTANFDDVETKITLVKLGLTMPPGTEHWLLVDHPPETVCYIFLRYHDPARSWVPPGLMVISFDSERYRSNPLAPDFGVHHARALFQRSVMAVSGVEPMNCTLADDDHSHN